MERLSSPHELIDRALLYSLVVVGLTQGVARYFIKPAFDSLTAELRGSFPSQDDIENYITDIAAQEKL